MIFILVSPVFFDLSKYICVDRSKFLLRTVTDVNMHRGYWQYWGPKTKKLLYIIGKKSFGSYTTPKPFRYGRFTDYRLPFHAEYIKLKERSLKEAFMGKKSDKKPEIDKKDMIMYLRKVHPEASDDQISRIVKCDLSYVGKIGRIGIKTLENNDILLGN
jgi:hypothetical protein